VNLRLKPKLSQLKMWANAATVQAKTVIAPNAVIEMAIDVAAAEAEVVVIATNAAKRAAQNAQTKPSATTTLKREHHAKTVATVATIVLANGAREANVGNAEKMRTATTRLRMPKMSAPRAWRQTQLSSAQKLAQRERRAAKAGASVAKGAANAVSAVAQILKIWPLLKVS
jgi:hypothetical protein